MTQSIVFRFLILTVVWILSACEGNPDAEEDTGPADSSEDSDPSDTDIPEELLQCAFGTGEYHDYFKDLGYNAEVTAEKLAAVWSHFFEGDPDTQAVYYPAGENDNGPLAYIMDIANNDVRSEGISYGMMIAVQLDKKDAFDALWNWAMTHMRHGDETHPFYEYFAWNLDTEGNAYDEAPAPDGEEYFATALYFADGRWGSSDGIYNYKEAADRLVSALKNREMIRGEYMDRGTLATDSGAPIFNPQTKMVRFSPKAGYFSTSQGDHTDPSYHLPSFYQLWSIFGPAEDRDFWRDAADASRDFFNAAADEETGLTPNYADFDGTPTVVSWNEEAPHYGVDSWRTVMNWSMDWAWFCVDERERTLSDKLQNFFSSMPFPYEALYELDGTPRPGTYYSAGPLAMNAVSALSSTDEELSLDFVQTLWDLWIPDGTYRYYDGMLYMLALLHVSGNFRVYSPRN